MKIFQYSLRNFPTIREFLFVAIENFCIFFIGLHCLPPSRCWFIIALLPIGGPPKARALDGPIGHCLGEPNHAGPATGQRRRPGRAASQASDAVRPAAAQPPASAVRHEAGSQACRLSGLRHAGAQLAAEDGDPADVPARPALVVRRLAHPHYRGLDGLDRGRQQEAMRREEEGSCEFNLA